MGRALAITLLITAFFAGRSVSAQGDPASKREARRLLTTGDAAFKKGEALLARKRTDDAKAKYEEALASYKKAYEVYPNPQIYFTIGRAEERLGLYLDAHRHYLRLIEEATSMNDDLRAAVEIRLDEVLKQLSQITLKVEPAGAMISIDDDEVGQAPVTEAIVLSPGEHKLAIRAEGYTPHESKFSMEIGEVRETKVELKIVSTVDNTPKPKKSEPVAVTKRTPGRGILIAGLATSATFAAAATVTGILAVSKHGTFTDDQLPAQERASARDSGKTLALTTDILIGATVLAGAFTAYYYYGVYRPRKQSEMIDPWQAGDNRDSSVWVTPYIGSEEGGLAVGGTF